MIVVELTGGESELGRIEIDGRFLFPEYRKLASIPGRISMNESPIVVQSALEFLRIISTAPSELNICYEGC